MSWYYHDILFDENETKNYIGFVYCLTNLLTGMKYIGKKHFRATRKLKPLKGKTQRRTKISDSNWKDYYGSSEEVQSIIEQIGKENFRRDILRLCKSKGEMTYYEMKFQLETDALLKPNEYYNAYVGGRVNRLHLKGLVDMSSVEVYTDSNMKWSEK